MTERKFFCPNCERDLEAWPATFFETVPMARVQCNHCGAQVIIEDDTPRLWHDDETP